MIPRLCHEANKSMLDDVFSVKKVLPSRQDQVKPPSQATKSMLVRS